MKLLWKNNMNENHITSLSDMEIYDGERASTYGLYEKIIVAILSIIMFFFASEFSRRGV